MHYAHTLVKSKRTPVMCTMPWMDDEQMPDEARRLKEARIARGFKTPKDAAKFFGWVYETFIQHEQGHRGIKKASKRYAEAFKVSEGWLLTGEGQGPDGNTAIRMIPIVGYVGAGAEIFPINDHAAGTGLDEVQSPWGELSPDAVAVRVRGNSMAPALRDKDIVIYDEKHSDFRHLVGEECVVALSDGRMFVKELRRTAEGQWFLHSHNMDPIFGVDIEWAAKVRVKIHP